MTVQQNLLYYLSFLLLSVVTGEQIQENCIKLVDSDYTRKYRVIKHRTRYDGAIMWSEHPGD